MERASIIVGINISLHSSRCLDLDRWAVNLCLEQNMLDNILEYKLLPLRLLYL